MESIIIEGTKLHPSVRFIEEEGLIEIGGRSIPEDTMKFYAPLLDWILEYLNNPGKATTVNIKFIYFNTSSSKYLLKIFKELEKNYKKGFDITINWYYDELDEDMMENGIEYDSLVNVPFNLIEVADPDF